jgi:uncharacterized damage-inducible protein DinB
LNKAAFLEAARSARRVWNELLSDIDAEDMGQDGAVGEWSVKDTIAHISWFEREMAELLETKTLVGSDLWNLPPDERNEAIYQQYCEQPQDKTLSESKTSFDRLVSAIEALEEDELSDPSRYKNMPPDWVPRQIIAQNSYEHYQHHVNDIRAWMSQT